MPELRFIFIVNNAGSANYSQIKLELFEWRGQWALGRAHHERIF